MSELVTLMLLLCLKQLGKEFSQAYTQMLEFFVLLFYLVKMHSLQDHKHSLPQDLCQEFTSHFWVLNGFAEATFTLET